VNERAVDVQGVQAFVFLLIFQQLLERDREGLDCLDADNNQRERRSIEEARNAR
jgi:hypothetical protein